MNRVAAPVIAMLTLLLFPALAGASHRAGPGGPRDFAVGGGTTGNRSDPTGVQHVDFAASGGPTTFGPIVGFGCDPVTGHFRAGGEFDRTGLREFQQGGPVTCLVVEPTPDGARARLVYPLKRATASTKAFSELLEDSEVLIFLEDNGPPKNGRSVDKIGFELLPDALSPDEDPPSEQDSECVAPGPPDEFTTLTKGNFTIHDGS
jgi:hypothetical protein